jgi:hypothetical protein
MNRGRHDPCARRNERLSARDRLEDVVKIVNLARPA